MLIKFKKKKNPAVLKTIMPGRRALGEQWREITIRPNEDGSYEVENEPAARPAQGRPVVIPAMAGLSDQEVNFILGGALKAQDYYSRQNRRPSEVEITREVNKMWADYVEQKLLGFKGTTHIGPGGLFQRQSQEYRK